MMKHVFKIFEELFEEGQGASTLAERRHSVTPRLREPSDDRAPSSADIYP